MTFDLFTRKQTHFVLWRPAHIDPKPTLYIGKISNRPGSSDYREIPLHQSSQFPDLWEIAAQACGLVDHQAYAYWFGVRDSNPSGTGRVMYFTDPLAYTVDRQIIAPQPNHPDGAVSHDPAAVIAYQNGQLVACDCVGKTVDPPKFAPQNLPANNRLVIYELPTRWTQMDAAKGEAATGNGTFQDVLALSDEAAIAPHFDRLALLQKGYSYLSDLGINALELLPPADSDDKLEWGYGTGNFLAADYDLGCAQDGVSTALTDLFQLVKACHDRGIRFFVDMVMAFTRNNPYSNINFFDFYIQWKPKGDPGRDPEQGDRDGFGGDLLKYNYWIEDYHPLIGQRSRFVPGREYMKLYLAHWMTFFQVDGLRLDSVNNIGNYDFLQEFKDLARHIWQERGGVGDRFLVVGEELSVPLSLVHQNRLDGLWNERFKQMIRRVILGKSVDGEPSFEWSVRKLIDCRLLGFRDGSEAVNYLTSHDVGGYGNERIYNYLVSNGVQDAEERIKLAFVCLMTAVGIPMIFAGDEFADQHDLDITNEHGSHKQVDPVNYSRLSEDWRKRVFDHVARLVKFRTSSDALAVNDVDFFHVDFSDGKRVIAWQRGYGDNLVVVVANFSDYGTPNPEASEYVVPNFPATPAHKRWKEITHDRWVASEWIGREPIYPWEGKVYALV
jgi:pullulanase